MKLLRHLMKVTVSPKTRTCHRPLNGFARPLVLLIALLAAGCGSSTLKIQSDPGTAKVYYENPDTRERRLLGETPLEMSYKEINNASSPFFTIVVAKDGFEERRVLIPDTLPFRSGSNVSLGFNLKKIDRSEGPQNIDAAVWNDAIELLFDAQKLALNGKHDPAIVKVNTAIKKTGGFHKAYTLLGSIYFLKKEYRKSLQSWETAAKLNSRDQEAARMITLLKQRIQMSRE